MSSTGVTLRPATDADYDFMRRLYHRGRAEEMRLFPFDDAQRVAFLDQQFGAQTQHYAVHYPACERMIVERAGEPIGRFWVDEWRDQIRLVDIALVPEECGRGTGTSLLQALFDRARRAGKPVTIHVEAHNRALGLYQRLGFEKIDTDGVYFLMKWTPDQVKTAS